MAKKNTFYIYRTIQIHSKYRAICSIPVTCSSAHYSRLLRAVMTASCSPPPVTKQLCILTLLLRNSIAVWPGGANRHHLSQQRATTTAALLGVVSSGADWTAQSQCATPHASDARPPSCACHRCRCCCCCSASDCVLLGVSARAGGTQLRLSQSMSWKLGLKL